MTPYENIIAQQQRHTPKTTVTVKLNKLQLFCGAHV